MNGGVGFLGITVLRVVQFAVLFRVLRKVVAGERFNAAVRREVGRKMAMLSLAAAGFAYAFVLLHAFRAPLENGRTDRVVSNLSLAVWYLIRMEVVTNVMFAGFLSGRFPSEEPEGPGMIVYAIVVVLLALPWSRLSSWRSLVGFLPYLIPSVSLVTLETDHLQYGVVAMCVLCVLEWGVVVAFRDVFPGGNLFGDVVNSGGVLSGEFFASGVCLGSAYLPLLFAQWLHVRLYRELLFHSTRSSHPIYTTLQDMVHLWESWKTPYGGIHLESALFISIEDQVVLKSLQDLSYSQEGNYKRGWDEEYVEADGMAVVVVFGGQSEVVSVGLDDTVGRLQRRINQLFFSVAHEDAIEVTFNDTVLHDPEQHLSDVGIAEGDTLYATLSKQYLSRRECYVLGINESSLSGRLPPPRHLLHHPETLEHFLNACFEFSGPALETFCALLSKPTNLCQILHRSEAEWCRYVPAIVTNAPPCQDFSVEDRYRMLRYMGFFESTLAVNALLRHVVRNGRRLPTTHIRYTLHLAHEVGTCPTLCAGMDEGDVIGCVLGASSVSEVCQILDLLSDLGFNEEMHAEGLIKRAMSRIKGRGDALLLLMIALMERGKWYGFFVSESIEAKKKTAEIAQLWQLHYSNNLSKKKQNTRVTYFAQGFAPLCSNYTRFVD